MQDKIRAAAARLCDSVETELAAARLNVRSLVAVLRENGATPAELGSALRAVAATTARLERVYGENLAKWEQLRQALDPAAMADALADALEGRRLEHLPDKQALVLDELNALRRQLLAIVEVLP